MAIITLQMNLDLNVSAQVGDTIYYVPTGNTAGFHVNSSEVIRVGIIVELNHDPNLGLISVDTDLPQNLWPNPKDFILFSKDNKVNMSNMLGYYAKVRMRNNSNERFELFKVNADYTESSK
tara:strand:- start:9688 stop:10050 length:363 start_codon:yes stop_codon:yes gene_type:complete